METSGFCSTAHAHMCARSSRGTWMAESRRDFVAGYACREVVELATEYLEGAMTPQQMTRFELHLNLCDGCFTFVEQVRATAKMARTLSENEIPEETKAKLLEAFRGWRSD